MCEEKKYGCSCKTLRKLDEKKKKKKKKNKSGTENKNVNSAHPYCYAYIMLQIGFTMIKELFTTTLV